MARARICADCAHYRSEARLHGSCTHVVGAPITQIDEARGRRLIRWNGLACDGFTESMK